MEILPGPIVIIVRLAARRSKSISKPRWPVKLAAPFT
jgi:hypothetical protein